MVVGAAFGKSVEDLQRQGRAADHIVQLLVDAGVDAVFGVPGGAIAPLHDALLDEPRIRVVTTRHEAGAMFAAAGYARSTGKPGVVLVTSGPGVLNTITGLASAHCDGLPVLVLAGEVPRSMFGKNALQEGSVYGLDVIGIARRITKLAHELRSPDTAVFEVAHALDQITASPPGPALVTLPLDVALAPMSPPLARWRPRRASALSPGRGHEQVGRELWRAARPLLFVGSGARWGDGPAAVRALAERLQAPVATTPKAKGVFPDDHPLSVGVFGHGGHPSARTVLEEGVDVLFAIGTGFTDPGTDGFSDLLRPSRALIRVDADPLAMGRGYPVTHALVGEAADHLRALLACLPRERRPERRFGVVPVTHPALVAHVERPITPQRALWEVQHVVGPDAMFTCDIGEHLMFATHYLRAVHPQSFCALTGLASMGAAVGTAMGAKLAHPERPVVAVCGDGGFAMMAAEIATAVQYGLAIKVVVLNDERFGMVEKGHQTIYGRHPAYPPRR